MIAALAASKNRLALAGGLSVTLLLFLLSFIPFFQGIELKTYDLRTRRLGGGTAANGYTVIGDHVNLASVWKG